MISFRILSGIPSGIHPDFSDSHSNLSRNSSNDFQAILKEVSPNFVFRKYFNATTFTSLHKNHAKKVPRNYLSICFRFFQIILLPISSVVAVRNLPLISRGVLLRKSAILKKKKGLGVFQETPYNSFLHKLLLCLQLFFQ